MGSEVTDQATDAESDRRSARKRILDHFIQRAEVACLHGGCDGLAVIDGGIADGSGLKAGKEECLVSFDGTPAGATELIVTNQIPDGGECIARIENSVIIYAQAMEKRKVIRDAKPCRQPHECLSRMLIYKNFMQEDRNLGTKIGTVAMIYKAFLEQVNGHTSCQISAGGMQDVHKEMVACRDEIHKHVRLCATIVKRFPQITEKIAKKIQSYHAAHEALVTSFECMHVFTSEMNKLGATVYEPAGDDQEPDQA